MDELHKEFATMRFKDWIISEINKGLARQFQQQNPKLPKYVAKQVLQNRVAPLWQNTVVAHSPTIVPDATNPKVGALQQTMVFAPEKNSNPSKPTYSKLADIYKDGSVSGMTGKANWKLQVVEVHPLHFTQDTIQAFLNHEFGSSLSLSKHVKNHDERMKTQSDLADQRGQGENEPIIMIRDGDKFRMQEGWHRLYSYLTKFSAPPEEQEKINNGNSQAVDFNVWKPVKIKAYIGE
jgi:hypothetical protein